MKAVTVLPEAIDALARVFATVPGVAVYDGPPMDDPSEPDVLYVGWGRGDIAAVSEDGEATDMSDSDDSETLTVVCAAASWSGDNTYGNARRRIVGILRDLAAALALDPSLGGVVYDARIRRPVDFDQEPVVDEDNAPRGIRAAVAFGVTCRVL